MVYGNTHQKCLIVINKNVENMEVLEVIDGDIKSTKQNEDSAMANAIVKLVE